jgi:hypothetical protein
MDVAFAEAKKMWKGTLAAPHEQKFEIFHNKVEDETKLISKNILVMRAKFLPKERYD